MADQLRPGEWAAAMALLEVAGLPTADLSPGTAQWFLAARHESALTGLVAVQPCGENGLLRSLAVQTSQRGHGVGQQLVAAAEAMARSQGLKQIYLLTTTAEPFFRRLGYRATPRETVPSAIAGTTEFREICPSTAHCLVKELSGVRTS